MIWAESLDDRLGPETRRLLLDSANRLRVSPVTTLELARLISLGRLSLRRPLEDWLAAARLHLGFEDAAFTHPIAMASYELPGALHNDPADRMMVATARHLDCALLTADEWLLRYPDVRTLDARR